VAAATETIATVERNPPADAAIGATAPAAMPKKNIVLTAFILWAAIIGAIVSLFVILDKVLDKQSQPAARAEQEPKGIFAPLRVLPADEHNSQLLALAFSPDSKLLVSSTTRKNNEGDLCIWNSQTGEKLQNIHQDSWANAIGFSPDGSLFASAQGAPHSSLTLWDTGSWNRVYSSVPNGLPWSLSFSRDGRWLATAALSGTVEVLELSTRKVQYSMKVEGPDLRCVCFSLDSRRLLTSGDSHEATVWDMAHNERLTVFKGTNRCAVYTPDGLWVVAQGRAKRQGPYGSYTDGNKGISVFALTGAMSRSFGYVDDDSDQAIFSPDGRWIVGATVKPWEYPFKTDRGPKYDPHVTLYDFAKGTNLQDIMGYFPAAFSPDGRMLALSADGVSISILQKMP
jgi:WD40 repeat protein